MKSELVILILMLLGVCMIGYGLYLIYPPVMWIVLGIFTTRLAAEGIKQEENK